MNLAEFKQLLHAIPESEIRVREINQNYFTELKKKEKNPNCKINSWDEIVIEKCPENLKNSPSSWKGFVAKYNAIRRKAKHCGKTLREFIKRDDLISLYHVK